MWLSEAGASVRMKAVGLFLERPVKSGCADAVLDFSPRSCPIAPARTRGSSPASRSAARRPPRPRAAGSGRPATRALEDVRARASPAASQRRLGRLQREAADEDGQAAEEGLLGGGEQVVAPGDRVAHRPQAGRQVARAAGQQRQAGRGGPAAPAAAEVDSGPRPARSPAAGRPAGGRSRRRRRRSARSARSRAGRPGPRHEQADRRGRAATSSTDG